MGRRGNAFIAKILVCGLGMGGIGGFPAHARQSETPCQSLLKVSSDVDEFRTHYNQLQRSDNNYIRYSPYGRQHLVVLKERAVQILQEFKVPFEISDNGTIKIFPGATTPQRSVDRVVRAMAKHGIQSVFALKDQVAGSIGAYYSRESRELGFGSGIITGDTEDLLPHELRHFFNARLWESGRKSPYNVTFYATGDHRVHSEPPYDSQFSIEELDAMKIQLIYLYRELSKYEGNVSETEANGYILHLLSRIVQVESTAITLAQSSIKWIERALEQVDEALNNLQEFQPRYFSSGDLKLEKKRSRRGFYLEVKDVPAPTVTIDLGSALVQVHNQYTPEYFLNSQNPSLREAVRMLRYLKKELTQARALTLNHKKNFELSHKALKSLNWRKAYEYGAFRL